MKVQVYIGEDKLDLFDDEKISVTQKLNDIEKLSNVFTDFTNSFTVPATPNNNRILKHYYDVDVDGSFNANIRIDGFIEIDTLPFKFGQFQLEGVVVKQNRPDNYKITFYSKAVQLSKLFGDDTIDQLDYITVDDVKVKTFDSLSQFDYVYSQTSLLDSLNNPSFKGGNVITPLIAYTDRAWQYGTNNTKDISKSSYPILDTELRPALKIIRIIEAIQVRYGITFKSNLFNETFFDKLFMWMNNTTKVTANKQLILLDTFTENDPSLYYSNVSKTDNTFSFTDNAYLYDPDNRFNISVYLFGLTSRTGASIAGADFIYEIFDGDGNLVHTETRQVPSSPQNLFFTLPIPQSNVPKNYSFRFKVLSTVDYIFTSSLLIFSNNFGSGPYDTVRISGADVQYVTVENSLPKMKVIDFLQGIMKMFKLVIRPITTTTFYIDTLDNFYDFNNPFIKANILDITKYVDTTNVNIDRPSIYKKIEFLYQKTENVLGKRFRETINDTVNKIIGYGDLKSFYPQIAEDNDLKVELPFENMLFERMTIQPPNVNEGELTEICIGESYSLNQDQITVSRNDSKPILFFNNGVVDISARPLKIKFNISSVQTLNLIYNIGNTDNQVFDDVTQTINWGEEEDPWHLKYVTQSLYRNFWSNWITTIYSIKQRKFKFEGYLPPRYIQELSLNDRLIIGQNKYKINDYTIDLVTGKTTFNLFTDIKKQQTI